jgi:diguanylate cyclase (GGDEF)-like protein/PAS domain S-box-containing protein
MRRWFANSRFWISFLLVAVLPMAGSAWLYLSSFRLGLEETMLRNLASIADKKSDQIEAFLAERLKDAIVQSSRERVAQALQVLSPIASQGSDALRREGEQFQSTFLPLVDAGQFYDVLLIDVSGNVVFSVKHESDFGSNLLSRAAESSVLSSQFKRAMDSLDADFSSFQPYEPSHEQVASFVVVPVLLDGHPIGAIALQLNLSSLTQVVADKTGLGLTGETVLAQRVGNEVLYTAPLNRIPDAAYRHRVELGSAAAPMQAALTGGHGRGLTLDYAKVPIVAVWRYLPALHWGMVVKIDVEEAFAPLYKMQRIAVVTLLLFLLLSGMLAFIINRRFSRADEAMHASQAHMAAIFGSSMNAIITVDAQHRVSLFNAAAERIFGHRASEVSGRPLSTLIPDLILADGGPSTGEPSRLQGVRANGESFPVEVSVSRMDQSDHADFAIILHDVSQRVSNEKRIHLLTQVYSALSQASHALIECRDEASLFRDICRITVEQGGMKMAWIGKLDAAGARVIPVASFGEGTGYLDGIDIRLQPDIPEGLGSTAFAFREGRAAIVQDFFGSPQMAAYHERASTYGWNCVASFPILREGKVYASLAVYHSEKNAFTPEIVELLSEMVLNVGNGLDRLILEEAKQKAEESMRLAATIYASSAEGVMVTDEDNLIIDVNPAFVQQTGYTLEEVQGRNPRILKSGRHDAEFYREMWDTLLNSGHWQGEVWDLRKDGTEHVKLLNISLLRDSKGRTYRHVAQFFDITDRKLKEQLIWTQANFDTLTGLPNRRLFYDRLEQELKKSHRTGNPLALLFIDLDRFKEINDTLGHAKGDLLLEDAARRIVSCVRETDTVARLGGDEFTVILPEFGERAHLERIVQTILHSLAQPFELGDSAGYISGSVGITLYPDDAQDVEGLLKHADQAMYVAKAEGRNRFGYFTESMQQEVSQRLAMTNQLRKALPNGELEVYYQPILELVSGRIVKAEALLRWQHPELGMVSPAKFIPLAEESGLIHEIGEWVFQETLARIREWHARFGEIIQVSVNKSPVQFEQPDSVSWPELIGEMGLPGACVTVEITEGLLLNKSARVKQRLLEFRNNGIEVSIDDFGTGFSALSYLKLFDIDYLKIDRSFVADLATDESDKALVDAIIVMAHKLGIRTIAEGVETAEQQDLLRKLGCDYVQGYFYSRPVPAGEFTDLLARQFERS